MVRVNIGAYYGRRALSLAERFENKSESFIPAIAVKNVMRQILAIFVSLVSSAMMVVAPTTTVSMADPGNSISICCAWGDKLADGELTYRISGGDDAAKQAVRNAIEEWDSTVAGLTLTEITGKVKADIDVKFKNGGGRIAGQTLRSFDSTGFVDGVRITISGSAFGSPNNIATVEQVTKHEIGHALGLGHANFDGDLMSTTVQTGTGTISACDVDGVIEANHWKLVDSADAPHDPHVTHVHC